MTIASQKFATLLTKAVRTIKAVENKTLTIVQDELGIAIGRRNGSCIEYWRKGYIPAKSEDVAKLAQELVARNGLDKSELSAFLRSADHPYLEDMVKQLFLDDNNEPSILQTRKLRPFVVGIPITEPRQFFGRTKELKRIFNLWKHFPLESIAIIGLKRSGKTSLLHYVKNITVSQSKNLRHKQFTDWLPHAEHFQWVFVDLQDARMCKLERLLKYLLSSIDLPVPQPCTLENFMDVVSNRLKKPTVILMDELGAGLAAPELDLRFWWSLRSLVSHFSGGNLAFVLTSHDSPAKLANDADKASPFFNILRTYELGPFSEEEALELIKSSPIPFPQSEINWIVDKSGCWPALLQVLSQTFLTYLEDGFSGPRWREEGLQQLQPLQHLLYRKASS